MPATPNPDLHGRIHWRTPLDARDAPPVIIRPAGPLERMLGTRAVRRAVVATVVGAGVAASMFATRERPVAAPGPAPRWDIQVASAGSRPVRALVFGSDAGIHLVRVPPVGAPPDARRSIDARLALGDIYLVSLGAAPLVVHTKSPRPIRGMSFSATARVVKLFQRPDATGIRTGW